MTQPVFDTRLLSGDLRCSTLPKLPGQFNHLFGSSGSAYRCTQEMTSLSRSVFLCRSSGQYRPVECSEVHMDYMPPSLTCLPNAADLPHSEDTEALNVVVRKQLDTVISRHVQHGLCLTLPFRVL